MSIAPRWTLIVAATASVALIAWLIYELSWRPRYDVDHPSYADLAEQLQKASELLKAEIRSDGDSGMVVRLDLGELNDGNWTSACFFGDDSNPTKRMREREAGVSPADAERFEEISKRGFRFAEVAEHESVVTFVDAGNQAHFLLFPIDFSLWGPGLRAYATKPDEIIRIW